MFGRKGKWVYFCLGVCYVRDADTFLSDEFIKHINNSYEK